VQVAEEVLREGEVTSSNPVDRVAMNFARKIPRLATSTETDGRWPVDAEGALPRAALGKGFAKGLRGFAESLEHSASRCVW
jgi:hypothetical protein